MVFSWIFASASAGYIVMAFVTLAIAAYARGQYHTEEYHSVSFDKCQDEGCHNRVPIYAAIFVFWWLFWIMFGFHYFIKLFEKGGANSKLPAEKQHSVSVQEPDGRLRE